MTSSVTQNGAIFVLKLDSLKSCDYMHKVSRKLVLGSLPFLCDRIGAHKSSINIINAVDLVTEILYTTWPTRSHG